MLSYAQALQAILGNLPSTPQAERPGALGQQPGQQAAAADRGLPACAEQGRCGTA